MNRPQQVPDNYAEATTNNSVIHAERATESYIQSDKNLSYRSLDRSKLLPYLHDPW
jgi:hypothetical protein